MGHSGKTGGARITRVSERLSELRMDFEAYRAKTPNIYSRRFPSKLRMDVLAALDEGVPLKELMVACRLTGTQIDCWKGKYQKPTSPRVADRTSLARVLNVVEHPHPPRQETEAAEQIEIRIGRWQLQLRLDPTNPSLG